VVAEENPEAVAAAHEDEGGLEDAVDAAAVTFKVSHRSKPRYCGACGQKQWKSTSGWVCNNGHGGQPELFIPKCCNHIMIAAEERTNKGRAERSTVIGFRCGNCGKSVDIADLTG